MNARMTRSGQRSRPILGLCNKRVPSPFLKGEAKSRRGRETPEGKEIGESSADLVGMALGTSLDKDKAVSCDSETETDNNYVPVLGLSNSNSSEGRVSSTLCEKRANLKDKETREVMMGNGDSNADKDEAVNCDSETETDNGPHPRWVPSAQANGPRSSDISSVDVYLHPHCGPIHPYILIQNVSGAHGALRCAVITSPWRIMWSTNLLSNWTRLISKYLSSPRASPKFCIFLRYTYETPFFWLRRTGPDRS